MVGPDNIVGSIHRAVAIEIALGKSPIAGAHEVIGPGGVVGAIDEAVASCISRNIASQVPRLSPVNTVVGPEIQPALRGGELIDIRTV